MEFCQTFYPSDEEIKTALAPSDLMSKSDEYGILKRFGYFESFDRFDESYQRFINGFSDGDIKTINNSFKRLSLMKMFPDKSLNLFTEEEKQTLRKIRHLFSERKELADGSYCLFDIKLPIDTFEIGVFYHHHGIHLISDFESRIKGKTIIDAGGFVGDSISIFRKYCNNPIYSFEPSRRLYELAKKTACLNKFDDVVLVNSALSDFDDMGTLFECGGMGNTMQMDYGMGAETIYVSQLDSYVEDRNIEVGLIKIDCEGEELRVLNGAKRVIRRDKPVIILSIYHSLWDFLNLKNELLKIRDDYTFKFFKGLDGRIIVDSVLICE